MYQVSTPYRRKNIGPLTQYGRFRSNNRSARRYNRGWRRPGAWGAIQTYRGIPRGPRSQYNMVTNVVKTTIQQFLFPGAAGVNKFGSLEFSLDDLSDYTNYTAIFDQWRIVGVQVAFINRKNVADQDDAGTAQYAQWALFTVDHDDATVPTTMASLQGYASCKQWHFLKTPVFRMFVRPTVTNAVFAAGAFTGYSIAKGGYQAPWIDCNNPDVKSYGLKWGFPSMGGVTENTYSCDIICKYYVQFRGQR